MEHIPLYFYSYSTLFISIPLYLLVTYSLYTMIHYYDTNLVPHLGHHVGAPLRHLLYVLLALDLVLVLVNLLHDHPHPLSRSFVVFGVAQLQIVEFVHLQLLSYFSDWSYSSTSPYNKKNLKTLKTVLILGSGIPRHNFNSGPTIV